eukprot:scaffold27535_cov69-Cyclotella_meneghiniana.AAC.1
MASSYIHPIKLFYGNSTFAWLSLAHSLTRSLLEMAKNKTTMTAPTQNVRCSDAIVTDHGHHHP